MEVGIFGLGRFGSFWSASLAHSFSVRAYDIDSGRPTPEGVRKTDLAGLAECDTIFLCVTIRSMPEVLRLLSGVLKTGTLVVDTCSVKIEPARWMAEILPEGIDILATHPMFGPESAKNGMEGLPLMMEPIRCDKERTAFWTKVFSDFGISVVRMSCDRHDREAAYSQALTHFVGRSLHRVGLTDTDIATRWYKNLHAVVRQCVRDAPSLFEDMQRYNPYAAEMRRRVMLAFHDTIEDVEQRPFQRTQADLDEGGVAPVNSVQGAD
ncbi:MAG: prephenate dehydrogenase/arogenate dehydrogenase family protein [Treponemataceae bacterium]